MTTENIVTFMVHGSLSLSLSLSPLSWWRCRRYHDYPADSETRTMFLFHFRWSSRCWRYLAHHRNIEHTPVIMFFCGLGDAEGVRTTSGAAGVL